MIQANGERTLRNKVGFVMVESYQNIIRHRTRLSPELEKNAGRSMFLIRQHELSFEVVAVNAVPNKEAGPLKALLANVSDLGPEQLKRMFLTGLQNESTSTRGGAGLGLIEMARRSGHDLVHHMVPVGADHQRYALRVFIGTDELPRITDGQIDELHAFVAAEDILLLSKGRCTDELHRTVMEMISKDLEDAGQRVITWTKCYEGANELMSAVGKPGGDALFVIGRKEQGNTLVFGFDMDPSDALELEKAIHAVNGLSDAQLQERQDALLSEHGSNRDIRFSGLVDLARCKAAPIQFSRTPNGDPEFMVIEIVI